MQFSSLERGPLRSRTLSKLPAPSAGFFYAGVSPAYAVVLPQSVQMLSAMNPDNLPADISAALDRWIAAQPDPKPSRADAIELALYDWLVTWGMLPPSDPEDEPGRRG